MPNLSSPAPEVLQRYYDVLTAGPGAYGDGAALRPLLSTHLEFSGSLAGHLTDATEGFLHGVSGFIGVVEGISVLRDVHDDDGSAVLYDATLPGGVVRFAEFFTFGDGVIESLFLHYDGADYVAKGGR